MINHRASTIASRRKLARRISSCRRSIPDALRRRDAVRGLFAVALIAAAVAIGAREASAAPRIPYGGSVSIFVFGPPLALDPRALAGPADLAISGAIYEPLYTIDAGGELEPLLARTLPELRGRELIVPLRTDVILHDGRPLTAAIAAQSLLRLAEPDSRASHILLPVKGALNGAPSIRAADDQTLVFELTIPYPELARLLASPRAAIYAGAGTGPWSVKSSAADNLTLAPFLGHRSGRPFLDTLIVRPSASRFGTVSMLRRGESEIVFGVPDTRAIKRHELLAWPKGKLPAELVVLSIGRQLAELRSEDTQRAIDAALNRATIAHRFLGGTSEPASTLSGENIEAPATKTATKLDATLLVSRDDGALRRVAERVQLDLLRAGITVIIERVPPKTLEQRRRDRRYDLMIDAYLPDGAASPAAIDRLHAFLAAAAASGAPIASIEPGELESFLAAPEPKRLELLPELERKIRARAALIPIATRTPMIAAKSELRGLELSSSGELILDDAHLAPFAQKDSE